MIDCCDLTREEPKPLLECSSRLLRWLVAGREKSNRSSVMIDNNVDNNPQRHRWTQDDTAYRVKI